MLQLMLGHWGFSSDKAIDGEQAFKSHDQQRIRFGLDGSPYAKDVGYGCYADLPQSLTQIEDTHCML